MSEVPIKDLLESGVHFGHQTRRWNPKMKKYIFTERNNIYIIDLKKTQKLLNEACDAVRSITAKGESILFVGTKPQAAAIIKEEALRCNQFYVTNRWLGGMLTNYRTIRQSIKRLEHIEKMANDGTYEQLTKKEVLTYEKHRERLSSVLDGIREMNRVPGLVIVVDTKKEKIAVNEANRLEIPVCAILDTNCDPDPITYPIPGNDDAIRSIKLLLSSITDAILEGMQLRVDEAAVAEKEREVPEERKAEDSKPKRRRPPRSRKSTRKPHREETEAKTADKAVKKPETEAKKEIEDTKKPKAKSIIDTEKPADKKSEGEKESQEKRKTESITKKKPKKASSDKKEPEKQKEKKDEA